MILEHMGDKQSSRLSEVHKDEGELTKLDSMRKKFDTSSSSSIGKKNTESGTSSDHPRPTRQGGRNPDSYKRTSEFIRWCGRKDGATEQHMVCGTINPGQPLGPIWSTSKTSSCWLNNIGPSSSGAPPGYCPWAIRPR